MRMMRMFDWTLAYKCNKIDQIRLARLTILHTSMKDRILIPTELFRVGPVR